MSRSVLTQSEHFPKKGFTERKLKTMTDLPQQLWAALYVLIAMVFGGLIGMEREAEDKPIGLRTNILIAGGSALFVFLGQEITSHMSQNMNDLIETDPTRIIQAIVVGISFIGAGAVLKIQDEQRIRFLTTAATILFSSAVGIAVALQELVLALLVTLLVLLNNYLLQRLF